MYNIREVMPIHRSIFGIRVTELLVNEVSRTEELQQGYTLFLIEDEKFAKILMAHYDRLPGRNFGDLLDGLEVEMIDMIETQTPNQSDSIAPVKGETFEEYSNRVGDKEDTH